MKRYQAVLLLVIIMAVVFGGCKKTYFNIIEEVQGSDRLKFTTKSTYLKKGKSIALTRSRYQLLPGDSTILFLEGQAKLTGVGETKVAEFDFIETALIYITLPAVIEPGRYTIGHKSICEIINSNVYDSGESLFIGQSGEVIIDSLHRGKYYGSFSGHYINTSNKSLTIEGSIKAGWK